MRPRQPLSRHADGRQRLMRMGKLPRAGQQAAARASPRRRHASRKASRRGAATPECAAEARHYMRRRKGMSEDAARSWVMGHDTPVSVTAITSPIY